MSARVHAIGIDIGSLYVKGVAIDASGRAIWRRTSRHQGNVAALVEQYLGGANGARVGLTTRGWAPSGTVPLDQVLCLAAGVRALCPDAANILEVGGSSLTLVRLDPGGQIQSVHRNSLCAAGTGSFLDEQAARLNLDVESLDGSPVPQPPSIAARCAVFAESDLIHRQQEGYSREVLWSGLCRGLADGVIRALTHGQPLWGRTALSGGVALNGSFVWWLRQALDAHAVDGCGASIEVVPGPEFTMALGAALLAAAGPPATPRAAGAEGSVEIARPAAPGNTPDDAPARLAPWGCRALPARTLLRSRYPERRQLLNETDPAGNEVSVHRLPADGARRTRVFLGVDVGSTSTKCALVGEDGLIVADVYRRTEGDPIGAARALLNAVVAIDRAHGFGFEVLGAATTGSGRKLVGTVIGADLVVNEISAHGAGALAADPKVETIFEIGGQDAKYLWVQDGRVADANMNYVCAAGTGSFVEALAAKLGYGPAESGEAVLGVAPPFTSSRCTVFMEQDVLGLVQRGASPAQAMGAVMYSVVENYLERVVGRRRVSRDRVVFQGATARNRGLVAAIENLLGVEVVVSPYCHVMGAYGAALLSRGSVAGGRTRFRGLDLGHRAITLEDETCRLCANACRVSRVSIEGVEERPAWGMLCGREDGERRRRTPPGYATYRRRARLACTPQRPAGAAGTASGAASSDTRPVVVVPRALTAYSFYPFWSAFFDSLGIEARLGPPTDQACLDLGKQCAGPELCLPLKTAHGHAASLLGDASAPVVFLPHMIADERVPGLSNAKFCPYVEALPSLVRGALAARGLDVTRLVAPVIDLSVRDAANLDELTASISAVRPVTRARVARALGEARAARRLHQDQLLELGQAALRRARESEEPAIVVIGRPYNTLDPAISLDLPQFLASCGVEVIPMDCLPFRPELLADGFGNMFWHYGQRIVSALRLVAENESLHALYLTNFGCGPDSFLLSYAEAIMGRKPFLVLELDEHGSSGGYQTRIEAFLDVARAARRSPP